MKRDVRPWIVRVDGERAGLDVCSAGAPLSRRQTVDHRTAERAGWRFLCDFYACGSSFALLIGVSVQRGSARAAIRSAVDGSRLWWGVRQWARCGEREGVQRSWATPDKVNARELVLKKLEERVKVTEVLDDRIRARGGVLFGSIVNYVTRYSPILELQRQSSATSPQNIRF